MVLFVGLDDEGTRVFRHAVEVEEGHGEGVEEIDGGLFESGGTVAESGAGFEAYGSFGLIFGEGWVCYILGSQD